MMSRNSAAPRIFRMGDPFHIFQNVPKFWIYPFYGRSKAHFPSKFHIILPKFHKIRIAFCPHIKIIFRKYLFVLIQMNFGFLNAFNSRKHIPVFPHEVSIYRFRLIPFYSKLSFIKRLFPIFSAFSIIAISAHVISRLSFFIIDENVASIRSFFETIVKNVRTFFAFFCFNDWKWHNITIYIGKEWNKHENTK